jgi:eukaryotic translation initiation factor 2C
MARKKFARCPPEAVRWGCVAIIDARSAEDDELEKVAHEFRNHVDRNCGLAMQGVPRIVRGRNARASEDEVEKLFRSALGAQPPKIILVLLRRDTALYASIKRVCDVKLGVHTVCMDWYKARKCQAPYFGNVALKWNLKVRGANHHLVDRVGLIKEGKTMFVGYDVTHPTNVPDTKKKGSDAEGAAPSIVGLVASTDKNLNQWPATAWVQPGGTEVCEDEQLTKAMASRLKIWKDGNGSYPEKIIIYRDGVSEGQFILVLEKELPRIREACRKVYPAAKQPQLAIIVSVKRHHTRFYPTTKGNTSRSGNIRPGTVVDRGVTQSRYWDFFLTAHDCLQGKIAV